MFGTQNTGGLFGAQNTGQQAQAPTTGLFGASTQQNTSTPQTNTTGNLFGNTTTASTGGLFGAQQTTATPSTGMFGNQQSTTTSSTGGLFGAQQTTATPSTGMFGAQQNTTTGGLFGNKPATAAQPTTGSLFGASQTNAQQPFGQSQNTAQNNPQITLQTKYSELPEAFQKELENIEKFIQSQIQASTVIASRSIEDMLQDVVSQTEDTKRKLGGLRNVLRRDLYLIEQLKSLVTKEVRHSDLVVRYIDNSRTEDVSKSNLNNDAYANYFNNFVTDLENRMMICRQNIEELEMNIKSSSKSQLTPTVIEEIIQSQYSSFMAIASKIAIVHDQTIKAKEMFMRYQDKYLGAPQRQSMDIQKDSSQMASYLVPSLQNGNQQAPIQPQKSLFGSTNTFAKPIAPITTTTTNSLFGNSLGSIAPKRSNSLGPDTKRAFGG